MFVYGTLCKHESNHRILADNKRVASQAWTKGKLFDTGFGYPAMTLLTDEWTYGELYEVGEATLPQLDQLEGFHGDGESNLYDRLSQEVKTDQGHFQALVYVAGKLLSDLHKEINGGDWRVYQQLQQNQEVIYFAYGSCMDTERFKLAGVDHYFQNVLGQGLLENYKLGFTQHSSDGGRADIIEEAGHSVEGKVYRLPYEALKYLYKREGVNIGGYRPTIIDVTINGTRHKNVWTFTVVDKKKDGIPTMFQKV